MNIAIISNGVVSNIAVFDSLQSAQTLLGIDNVRAIPDTATALVICTTHKPIHGCSTRHT